MKQTLFYQILGIVAFLLLFGNVQAQTLVNKEWEQSNGIPDSIAFSASTLDGQENLIVTSNAITAGQQANLLVMKYDKDGNLLWQDTYNGAFNGKDYGIALTTDNSNNIYVAGASQTGAISSDYIIRKYDELGVLQWSSTYSGSGVYNAPTAICVDNSGNVFATGATFSLGTQTDYATLKFDSNGVQQWLEAYNYANLYDVPAGIEVGATGNVYVTGASASSNNNYDYATVEYDALTGNQVNVSRVTAPGSGFDKATAMARDNAGNLYITGSAFETSTNSYDIKTIKLNSSLVLQWIRTYDKAGLEDVANTIDVDNGGNVYVGGYVTTSNEGRNFITLKYDANGNLLWDKEYNDNLFSLNDELRKLDADDLGSVIVTGESEKAGGKDFVTIKYDADGELVWLKEFDANNGNDSPTDVKTDGQGNTYVTGKAFDGTSFQNTVVKYSTFVNPINVVLDSLGNPMYISEQIIVKFVPSFVNTGFVDNKDKLFDMLNEVVPDSIVVAMEQKTGISLRKSKAEKIFTRLTTADSISISRLGENIKLPPFWSAFVITLPNTANIELVMDSLNQLTDYVEFSHPNWIGKKHSVPNDSYYSDQKALHLSTFAAADINVEGAWDIQTGQDTIRVGVCDDPIFWGHEDFGNGTYNGSKIKGGWDWGTNAHISNVTNPLSEHGTACAGIIGALRNNHLGISGIAGGDVDNLGNSGIKLYSMGILHDKWLVPLSYCVSAIVEASTQTNSGYGYGLNILSNSYGFALNAWSPNNVYSNANINLLAQSVKTAWHNHCLFVASRGNDNDQVLQYPGCYEDAWVMCVGASGTDGLRKTKTGSNGDNGGCFDWGASFGSPIDVVAPGVTDLVITTNQPNLSTFCVAHADTMYRMFNGSSASVPHVAGVAALMMSEHHTMNGYPNNLIPEDVEELIQIYAADRDGGGTFPNGYDADQGWGLLDATNVMQHIDMPTYRVIHSGIPLSTTQIGSASTTIFLPQAFNGLAAAYYIADRIDITHNYLIALPTLTTQIINSWIRPSAITGISASNTVIDRPYANLSIATIPGAVSVNAITSFWHVTATYGGSAVDQWLPTNPSQAKSAFSLHLYDPAITIATVKDISNLVSVYPIPFSDIVHIDYNIPNSENLHLQISDVTGKIVFEEKIIANPNGQLTVNLKTLSNGVYICKLSGTNYQIVKKIIKN